MAKGWRLKFGMESEDDMKILLFLMIVGAYRLPGQFKAMEIRSLFERVKQHKQTSLLGHILGFSEKAAPESCFPHCQEKMEQLPEGSKLNLISEAIDDKVIDYTCPSSADLKFIASTDAGRLLMFLNEHQNEDKIGDDVYNALKMSGKPEKLVLNVVKAGISEKANVGVERGLVKNSCVILLEQLMRLRPGVSQKLMKKALKVAQQLKGNIRTQGNYDEEVLIFLMVICAYGLSSEFNFKEIECLFWSVSHHKQAPILGLILGFVDQTLVRGVHHSQANIEQSEARIKLQSYSTDMDAKGLTLFICEHLEDHIMRCEISDALLLAPNPAKLVLDALSTFYDSKSGDAPKDKKNNRIFFNGEALFKVRKSCILLLEQLRTVSFWIEPHLNEEVLKLAADWKERMQKSQKGVMAYGLLQLIVTYRLMSAYYVDELICILVIASKYRQSPGLCLALGLTDKIQVLIETLVKNNLRLEAIAYVCAFDLVDEFPPAHMLKVHLENSKKSLQAKRSHWKWRRIIDHEIVVVRKVIRCIADHKLESVYPPNYLEDYIIQLERQKTERYDAARKQKQRTGQKLTLQIPSEPQLECGTKLPSIIVSVEAGSRTSSSASSTVTLSPLQLLESFFADQAVPNLLGDSTNFSANANQLIGKKQADVSIIADDRSSDSD